VYVVQFNEGVCKKIELAEKEGAQCKKNLLKGSRENAFSTQSWKLTSAKNLGGLTAQPLIRAAYALFTSFIKRCMIVVHRDALIDINILSRTLSLN